jgi:hypothetical protein
LEAKLMAVLSFLVVVLTLGFVGVGFVGFFGWRARMRSDEDGLEGWAAGRP